MSDNVKIKLAFRAVFSYRYYWITTKHEEYNGNKAKETKLDTRKIRKYEVLLDNERSTKEKFCQTE